MGRKVSDRKIIFIFALEIPYVENEYGILNRKSYFKVFKFWIVG
jgi:hypothetical protein